MRNFIRALRHTWPYRGRFILSLVCAVLAAMLWGLNFTSIYPILKILGNDQTLVQDIDARIAANQKEIETTEAELRRFEVKAQELVGVPSDPEVEHRLRDLTRDQVKREAKIETLRRSIYRWRLARKFAVDWLPEDSFKVLAVLLAAVLIATIIKCVFEFLQDWLVGSIVGRSLYDLRNRFYQQVLRQDVNQFNERGTADLMSRFTSDMEALGTGTKTLMGKVVAEPLRVVACVVLAGMISWRLTLLFLVMVPIAGFLLGKIGRTMKQATRRLLERVSTIFKILQESFAGIRVVKIYTMEPYERRRFRQATRDYYKRAMKVVKIDAFAGPTIEVLGIAAVAAALLVGSYLVLRKETSIAGLKFTEVPLETEELLQLYVFLVAIADPVRKLSSVFTKIQAGEAAADRIFQCLDREPRIQTNPEGPRVERDSSGALRLVPQVPLPGPGREHPFLEFRDVCFSYDPGRPILSHISLEVRRGEVLALVGGNGCGKSTLLSLLPRFQDPDHGSILFEGADLRGVNLRSFRRQVGMVTQETVLFDDTIFNNIAYGHRNASPEMVEAAAKKAFAHSFIMSLPQGYQTPVGECGGKLSGGQKQRICLARAILRDPAIMLLDEFTSQTDAESEALIHEALREFLPGRTVLVITHRLQTLEIADRILVLDQGKVVALGSHAELMQTNPFYQRFHQHGGGLRHAA